MKVIYYLSSIAALVCLAGGIRAMQPEHISLTQRKAFIDRFPYYKGSEITPEALLQLQEIPTEVIELGRNIIQEYPELIQTLVVAQPQLHDLQGQLEANREAIQNAGLKNLNPEGFGFRMALSPKWCAKFPGHIHSAINVKVGALGEHFNTPTASIADKLMPYFDQQSEKYVKTYQGASRLAAYLKAKEFCENNLGTQFCPVPTYCIPVNEGNADCSDRASFIIEQYMPGDKVTPDMLQKDMLPELLAYMKATNMWHIGGLYYDQKTQKYHIRSNQQPNNTCPYIFYFNGKEFDAPLTVHGTQRKIRWNLRCGIEELYKFLKQENNQEKLTYLRDLVNKDSEIQALGISINPEGNVEFGA